MGTGYLDALGQLDKPAQSPAKKVSGYLEALDALDAPKNTKLQSDTQLSQLDQPTGTFDQQRKPANISLDFESPQEAYVNEPARRVARAKESAGTIGPQKLYPSGKADVPKPPMLPQFIKNLLPDQQVDVPESVNTFLGGLKGKASQLPVNDGVTAGEALNRGGELYEDIAHKPHLPLGELADQYISSGAPTTGRASLFGGQALRGVANAVEPFTTTENLALAGAGVPGGTGVQKAASAYFADQALNGLENDIGDVVTGKKNPVEGIASGLVNFGIAKGALGHAMSTEAAAPVQEAKQGGSPRLNFLQPQDINAPMPKVVINERGQMEQYRPKNAAAAEEQTGQQQLDERRGFREAKAKAAEQERMQQPAAMSYLDALDSVSPAKESPFKVGDEVPQNATPEQLSAIGKAGFEIGQDGRLAEKAIPPSLRVGEEVPGLDQQAEALQPKKPIITPPPPTPKGLLTGGSQSEGIRTPNESSPENAPQGDLIPTEQPAALPGQEAQEIQPSLDTAVTEVGKLPAEHRNQALSAIRAEYGDRAVSDSIKRVLDADKNTTPVPGFLPKDLANDRQLLGEEAAWTKAVKTPGSSVVHDSGWKGKVIAGAEDPVNGVGKSRKVLVERSTPDGMVQQWHNATELSPAKAEVHPKYEQIGIDADSGHPILKQKAERRLDTTERKRVSQMSPEEMQKELLTSESLNLPNKRAFLEEEARNPSPAISMSDADGLKAFNDKFGYEYGNKLLEAKAEALKEAGLDAYHEKGDEFLQRDGSPEDLQNKLEKARELLRNKEIEVELNDGTIKKYQGVDFSYGVGKDLSEAEANLKQHKADREARGERARGELRGITEAGSQADQVPQGSQLEASPARAEASQPQGSVSRGVPPAGGVGTMPTADISVNPHRFQFKLNTDSEGVGTLLKEAPHYNDELAGTISVWTDPADGKTYVINGHHRLELAKRTGQREVAVRHIRARDAAEARSVGALQNIAEGRGTAVDAAKFFRESGMTAEDVKASGVSLGEATAKKGLALSRLDDSLFNRVVQGDLREGRAAAIGEATGDHAEQKAIADLVDARERKGKTVTDETLKELIRFVRGTGQSVESTMSLFGEQQIVKSYALEKAEISAYIKGQLAKDRKLFGFVSDAGRAERLRAEKAGTVKTGKAAKISEQAAQAEEVYNRLSDRSGPVADILEKSAREIAEGGKADAVKSKAYGDIRTEISKSLSGSEAGASAKSEAGSGQGTAASQKRGVSESRSASLGVPPDKAQFRNPNPSPNLIGFIEDAGSKLKIEPYHDQARLDGSVDKQFIVKDGKSYRIVTEERLRGVLEDNPEMLRIHPSKALDTYRAELLPKEEAAQDLKLEMQDAPPEKTPTLFGPGDLGEIIGPTGKQKRLVSDEAYDQAIKAFREKTTRLSAGVDVTAIKDLAVIGAYHFESGIRTFAEWSKKMVAELGEAVRPHLTKVWNDIQEKVANGEPLPKTVQKSAVFTKTEQAVKTEQPVKLAFLQPKTKAAAPPPKVPTFLKSESAPEGKDNFAGNINLDKLNTPEQIKAELQNVYRLNKDKIETRRRGVVSDASVEKAAREMGLTADDISKWKKGGAKNAETIFAARHVMVGTAEALNAAKDKFLKSHSPLDLANFQEAVAKHVAVQTSVAGVTAEAGRALRQYRLISEAKKQFGRTNTEKVLDSIREAQGDNWEAIATEVAKKLAQIPEGDTVALNKFLRNYAQFKTIDKVHAYWVSNVLSGPRTQSRNFISNQIFGLLQPVTRGVAAGVDAVSSKITGAERQTYAREVIPATMAYFGGIPDGLRRAAHIIQHGYDLMDAGKLEVPHGYEFPGGLKNPFNAPGRLLLAADAMSKTMHLQSELYALATRQAIREGLSGNKLAERSFDLANNPTAEMVEQATKYSRWATFNDRPTGAIASIIQAREKIKPLKFIAPFINTPTNILKRGIEYSPAGLGRLFTEAGKKESSSVIARAAIGSMAMAGFAALAANGKLTGAAPSDADQRDAFYRAGKQPFSVKVGDRWVAYNQMGGPLSITMAAVAAFHDAFQQSGEVPTEKKIGQAAGVIGKSIVDASFFKGISDAIDAIREPERSADNLFSSVAQGFVPFSGFLRNVAESQDEIIRDPQTMYERILTGIPGASKTVAPKIDPLGREVRREGGEGALAFLPSRIPKDQPKSGVDSELTRLGVTLSKVGSQISVKNQKFELDKDQQRELQKLTGNEINSVLANLFSRGNYKALDDEKKALIVDKAIRAVREKARAEYLQRIHADDLTLKPKTKTLPYFLGQPAS